MENDVLTYLPSEVIVRLADHLSHADTARLSLTCKPCADALAATLLKRRTTVQSIARCWFIRTLPSPAGSRRTRRQILDSITDPNSRLKPFGCLCNVLCCLKGRESIRIRGYVDGGYQGTLQFPQDIEICARIYMRAWRIAKTSCMAAVRTFGETAGTLQELRIITGLTPLASEEVADVVRMLSMFHLSCLDIGHDASQYGLSPHVCRSFWALADTHSGWSQQ